MTTSFKRNTPLVRYDLMARCLKCGRRGAYNAKWHSANEDCFGRHEEHMHLTCMCGWQWLAAPLDCDGPPDVRILLREAASKARERQIEMLCAAVPTYIKDPASAATLVKLLRNVAHQTSEQVLTGAVVEAESGNTQIELG